MGQGILDRNSTYELLKSLGHNCTEAELADMAEATDPEEKGKTFFSINLLHKTNIK